jgi:hypothetical protein
MALILISLLQQTVSGKILSKKNNTNIISLFKAYIVKIYSLLKINPQVTKAQSTQLGTSENIRLLFNAKHFKLAQTSLYDLKCDMQIRNMYNSIFCDNCQKYLFYCMEYLFIPIIIIKRVKSLNNKFMSK